MLCAKFQNDLTTEIWGIGKQVLMKFKFKMGFRQLPYNATNSLQLWIKGYAWLGPIVINEAGKQHISGQL